MKYYDVGVAIPNYNNAQYLEKCIESIINQTYKNIRILVVDDCSIDNSVKILTLIKSKYSNFDFVINKKNHGVSYTRDKAIRLLTTEYVTAIDSDDFYYSKKKIENEILLIKKFKKLDKDIVAFSNIIDVDSEGSFLNRGLDENDICNGNCFERYITRSARIPTCSVFSKKLFERVGGFDTNIQMYEDWDFKIRLSKIVEFYYTDKDGFAYRHHNKGLSSVKKEKHKIWIEYVFEKNSKTLKNIEMLREILYKNTNPNIFIRIKNKIQRILSN